MIARALPAAALALSIVTSRRKSAPRSRCTKISPTRGGRPFGRNTAALVGHPRTRSARRSIAIARRGYTGKPSHSSIDGARISASDSRPWRAVVRGAHHVRRREERRPALGHGDRRCRVLDRDLAHGPTLLARLDRCGSSIGAFRRTTTGPTS